MKVLLQADAVGGVFTYAVELSRALAARGVRVVLATEGRRLSPDQREALAGIPGLVHEEGAFALEWMDDPWEDVAAAGEWLLAIERRERPDVVHLNAFSHGALPFRAPKLVVGHSCVSSWFEAVRGTEAPPSWARYRAAVAAGLRGADAVAAPTAWMAAALVRHHGPVPSPAVLPNGRDPALFRPGAKEELVLGAGRLWDEAKNAAALARVAPALPWPVAIAGETATPTPTEGSVRPELVEGRTVATSTTTATPTATSTPTPTPSSTSTEGSVRPELVEGRTVATSTSTEKPFAMPRSPLFLGRLPEAALAAWLSRAAIFAHPARYEPFGLAVLEAALCGCALVLGDIASLRETWDGAAELVPPGDDAALAAALRALARDPARRAALAEAGRARALAWTPSRMAEACLAVYRDLVARRAAAGARA